MARSLAWCVALSTLVAAAITFMLNRPALEMREERSHSVHLAVSILGRTVTIGVSVEASAENRSDTLGFRSPDGRVHQGQVP